MAAALSPICSWVPACQSSWASGEKKTKKENFPDFHTTDHSEHRGRDVTTGTCGSDPGTPWMLSAHEASGVGCRLEGCWRGLAAWQPGLGGELQPSGPSSPGIALRAGSEQGGHYESREPFFSSPGCDFFSVPTLFVRP